MVQKIAQQKEKKKETRRGYRFSRRTIENLEYLIKTEVVRNETEAIDLAIEHFTTMYQTGDMLTAIKRGEISLVTHEIEIAIEAALERSEINLVTPELQRHIEAKIRLGEINFVTPEIEKYIKSKIDKGEIKFATPKNVVIE